MGFINHGGMWDDLILLSIANAIIVPHVSWGIWIPIALIISTIAALWVHHHWYRGDRPDHSCEHMWPSRHLGTWYGDLSWAGWLHVLYVAGELTLLIGFLLHPMPTATVLAVTAIFTIHVPIGLLQPRWFLTRRIASPRQQPLLIPLLVALWIVAGLKLGPLAAAHDESPAPRARLPEVMVWAWERPEDLRALDPSVGVAFLAQTITLSGERAQIEPRRQPLRVHPAATLMAVTRIEASDGPLAGEFAEMITGAITRTTTQPLVRAVQIDFDATASQRPFYRTLLERTRATLSAQTPLSITALASWCVADNWIRGLTIDEAVPMLFRMGPANEPYRALAASPRSSAPECAGAVGVSLDEPLQVHRGGRRLYVFNNRPWTAETMADVQREAAR